MIPSTQVRAFRAADARTALAQIKATLGPNAVIVSTREIPGGLFRDPTIEVLAAAEPPRRSKAARARGREETEGRGRGQGRARRRPARSERRRARAAERPAPPAPRPAQGEIADLRSALADTQRHLSTLLREVRGQRRDDLPPACRELYGRLLGAGVEEALAEAVAREAFSGQAAGDAGGSRDLRGPLVSALTSHFLADRPPWLPRGRFVRGRPNVLALVGPTGVGKTTTVAKIAAKAVLEGEMSVALVTVDNYRIGAREQLERYASLMRVPLHVARTGDELRTAVHACKDRDLILIDTAGRAALEDVHAQAELLRSVASVRLFLVLSATAGHQHLAELATRFAPLAPDRLIFSKLDETSAPGGLLTALSLLRRPVACLTTGQRVPQDICSVDTETMADLFLGTAPAGPAA